MRTPREILFERHAGVESKLDAVRRAAMAELREPACQPQAHGDLRVGTALKLWRELVRPCRRAWCGLAVVWVVLLLVNLDMRSASQTPSRGQAASTAQVVRSFEEEQRLLAELLQPAPPTPAEPPRPNLQPRSERRMSTKIG